MFIDLGQESVGYKVPVKAICFNVNVQYRLWVSFSLCMCTHNCHRQILTCTSFSFTYSWGAYWELQVLTSLAVQICASQMAVLFIALWLDRMQLFCHLTQAPINEQEDFRSVCCVLLHGETSNFWQGRAASPVNTASIYGAAQKLIHFILRVLICVLYDDAQPEKFNTMMNIFSWPRVPRSAHKIS